MRSKGLWRDVEGKAVVPKPYAIVNNIPVLLDGKTPALKEQIEMRETRIIGFKSRNILLNMSSS